MFTRKQTTILQYIALIGLIVIALSSCGNALKPPIGVRLVTDVYTVQKDDTLWSISETYMAKNTYGTRNVAEFYEGIIELNYELFRGRERGMIKAGDELKVKYWTR